jgi:hypothetical protein
MKTPKQIETALAKAAIQLEKQLITSGRIFSHDVEEAKRIFQELREAQGFSSSAKLFSREISKLNKDEAVILGLPLLPATHSGIGNLCAFSDTCADDCVAFAGNGMYPSVYKSRMAKTELLVNHPRAFMALMISELFDEYVKAQDMEQKLAVRLNTYSDIRWEKVAPFLFDYFRAVQFYDYTKHTTRSRPESSRPLNYHLTYSVSENTTANELEKAAIMQRPLAVVVRIRSGKVKSLEGMRPLPETWAGMPVIDGDESDARWTTPPGNVVLLRRKHTMNQNHAMIAHAEKLEKGLNQ